LSLHWQAAAVANQAIDWAGATRMVSRMVPVTEVPADLTDFIADLRANAYRAGVLAAEVTGLRPIDGRDPAIEPIADIRIVDRAAWAKANIETFAQLLDPVLADRSITRARWFGALDIAAPLALLSPRVLGQFDPFSGRLLVVAPNIVTVGTELGASRPDFALWVCLHEQTHALQMAAAPWIGDIIRDSVQSLMTSVFDRMAANRGLAGLWELSKRRPKTLIDLVLTPEEQAIMDTATGVMSLLEGHADVSMDAVGPGVIPSVATLRTAFEHRRDSHDSPISVLISRLLGLDAKLAQYRQGAAFVRAVTDEVGPDGFAQVWLAPANLPSRAEILEPALWIRRVIRT